MAWAYSKRCPGSLGALALAGLFVALVCYWAAAARCVSGRARGAANGSWVVAGGVSLAALSVALVWARGVPPQLTFLFWGRKLSWKPTWSRHLARPVPKRVKAASQRAWSRVAPLDLWLKLLEERRHARLRYLVLDLGYGFRDPLLTGKLVGALSMLSAVLPARVEIRQAPRWDFEDTWEIAVDGRAIVKPWLMLLDVLAYVVRQITRRGPRRKPALGSRGSEPVTVSAMRRQQNRGSGREPPEGGSGHHEERDDHRRARSRPVMRPSSPFIA